MPIINTVEGNLITRAQKGRYSAIIQGCNCFCNQKSGLAPQMVSAWPGLGLADDATIKGDTSKLGDYSVYHDTSLDLFVFNLYTQFGYGEKPHSVNYEAVRNGFANINRFFSGLHRNTNKTLKPIGIAKIGAGLARGHWAAIEVIINLVTPDIGIELVILDLRREIKVW